MNEVDKRAEPAGRWVDTICGFCYTSCGLRVYTKAGVMERIKASPEHPANRGTLCPKGAAGRELVYSPDRLKYPLMKTANGFQRVSWDAALDFIARKLIEIRSQYGAQTLMRYGGAVFTVEAADAFLQLLAAYGSANDTGPAHLCSMPRWLALGLVYGGRTDSDYDHTSCLVLWGTNPPDSCRLGYRRAYGRFDRVIAETKKRGAKLIVIDPRYTRVAALADEWLQIRPGTDAALALAMINVVIAEGLYDREFVRDWTIGFAELAEHVQQYSPQWAEGITGVPASRIRHIAKLYATSAPASITDGNGLDQHTNVVQTMRAIGILTAITGNVDVPGGNVFSPLPVLAPYPTVHPGAERIGADKYPLSPQVPFPAVVDALLTGQPYLPRAMIVHSGNPLLISADERKVRDALHRLELLVVCELFMTATAELADVILPAASEFERFGLRNYASAEGGFISLRQKVVEPVGESRPLLEIEYELAGRMGLAETYPWRTAEEWVNYRLSPHGITMAELRTKPFIYVTPPLQYRKYQKRGFNTPSKKVELYSERLRSFGYEPLPVYTQPAGEPTDEYPLIGTTRRPGIYVHTRFRNLPMLRRLQPHPLVRINPEDAQSRAIREGDLTVVESAQGSIKIRARVTDEVAPGLVAVDFGWGNPGDEGANVNILTSDEPRDPICAATPNRRFACSVRKA